MILKEEKVEIEKLIRVFSNKSKAQPIEPPALAQIQSLIKRLNSQLKSFSNRLSDSRL